MGVAYVEYGGVRVVAGPPIGAKESLGELTRRFVEESRLAGRRVLFFSVEASFLKVLQDEFGDKADSIAIGEQPEWELQKYGVDTPRHKTLRSQVRRAARKGVEVRMLTPEELIQDRGALRAEIESVVEKWKAARKMSPMRFLVDLQPLHLPLERRYFIAEQNQRAVGLLIAIPVYAREGWFLEDVLRIPDAPNGTVEMLIHTAMTQLQEEGARYATLGLCPLANLSTEPGKHRTLRRLFSFCYEKMGPLYQFKGLHSFKQRFVPHEWQTEYLATVGKPIDLLDIHVVLRAFSGDGLIAFAYDTAQRLLSRITHRQWAIGLFSLAGLLVPWTFLLAIADGEYWFGDVSIQRAWVAFDSAMVLALTGLGTLLWKKKESAHTLSIFLAGATLTDFVLTTVQAFHLHHGVVGWTGLFVLAGAMGPLFATLVLMTLGMNRPGR